DPRRDALHRLERVAVRVVELDDRAGDGFVGRGLPEIRRSHVMGLEERIAEYLVEVGNQARLAARTEALQLSRIELRQLEQKGGRQGTLVMLDQVEIGARDAELLCEIDLAQPVTAPQHPNFCSELGRSRRHSDLHNTPLYKYQQQQVNRITY